MPRPSALATPPCGNAPSTSGITVCPPIDRGSSIEISTGERPPVGSGPFLVDRANACSGPWGCDIAHCRDNLIQLGGFEAADAFLRAYFELADAEYDPFFGNCLPPRALNLHCRAHRSE